MGFRIENYSLNELHRIAVPGTVTPSLFWVLPIGNWRAGDLDEVWQWFTKSPSMCRDYGLLLVKERGQAGAERSDVSLASLGAKLSDLMPGGAERFVSPSAFREDCPKVLVLSGAYPQPGWGVLVEWPQHPSPFERLIQESNTRLSHKAEFADALRVFSEAATSFHRWRSLRLAPEQPDLSSAEREILNVEEAAMALREAQASLEAKDYRLVGKKLVEAINGVQENAWLNVSDRTLRRLLDAERSLIAASSILAIPEEVLGNEIEPKLALLITNPSGREVAFKGLRSVELKHALSACLNLRDKHIVEEGQGFRSWAEQTLSEVTSGLAADLASVIEDLVARLTARRGEHAQVKRDYELAMDRWRKTSREARDSFHRSTEQAAELQWHLGPEFLLTLEDITREEGLWVRSIPWDPARMVGWKIMARDLKLEFRDLEMAAKELSPVPPSQTPLNGQASVLADGSYFTDYVHHIAISKPGFSPRTVTCDLIARLLRPAEMMALIEKEKGQIPDGADAACLADAVINLLGWLAVDEVSERPLADCIRTTANGALTVTEGMSGNDVRIVLESFCKDLLDVIVVRLGYSHDEVWNAINERVPDYKPRSKQRDWGEEVRQITSGSAVMLLRVLGSLAFPARENEVNNCVVTVAKLSDALNQVSHHRARQTAPSVELDGIADLILEVLANAQKFLGELPWHLNANFVYGEQPKVVSGEAWSHGCAAPRMLRVILWDGAALGPQIMLWNKTGRNPIVTDPVFIVRPRRR